MKFTILYKNIEKKRNLKDTKRFIHEKLDSKQGNIVYNKLIKGNHVAFVGLDNKHYYIEKS